jgi:hypothetical protein
MAQLSDDDILILQDLVSRLRGMTDDQWRGAPFHVAFPLDDDHPTDEQYYVDVRFEKKSL